MGSTLRSLPSPTSTLRFPPSPTSMLSPLRLLPSLLPPPLSPPSTTPLPPLPLTTTPLPLLSPPSTTPLPLPCTLTNFLKKKKDFLASTPHYKTTCTSGSPSATVKTKNNTSRPPKKCWCRQDTQQIRDFIVKSPHT